MENDWICIFVVGMVCLWNVGSPMSWAQGQGFSLLPATPLWADSSANASVGVSALAVYGDARIRFETTTHLSDGASRNRHVFRVRLGAEYAINDRIVTGLRLATGSPDDPNSTDVTLGDFNDDLGVSLDRAFLRHATETVSLTGGKFENPFASTDLVWDGDVNPQGAAGTVALPRLVGIRPTLNGLFFFVDEQSGGPNSLMVGGQLVLASSRSTPLHFEGGIGYYDYEIRSLDAAGPGDTRSNRLNPGETAFRSDFDLVDLLARVVYDGWGPQWPVQATLNYVHNAGAFDDEDDGIRVAVQAGREAKRGDMQLRYGYTRAETDAVLAAFSNDNTTLPTNYQQHAVSIDYVVLSATTLNLTGYVYRPLRVEVSGIEDGVRFRLRLNLSVSL